VAAALVNARSAIDATKISADQRDLDAALQSSLLLAFSRSVEEVGAAANHALPVAGHLPTGSNMLRTLTSQVGPVPGRFTRE